MQVTPYLYFEGRAAEALAFYETTLGARIGMAMRFGDMPPDPQGGDTHDDGPHAPPDKIMHASVRIGDTVVYVSDGRCRGAAAFEGFALSLNAATDAEADAVFAALADGGDIRMPMSGTFFASRFGMVADKFGIVWMVVVERAPPRAAQPHAAAPST
jgi:PhnB protein